VDGTGLVGGDGEAGLVDHGLQGPLLDSHRVLVIHLRQLRVVLGGKAHDLKAGVAAGQAHHIFLIRRKHHQIVRQNACVEHGLPPNPEGKILAAVAAGVEGQVVLDARFRMISPNRRALRTMRPSS